MVNLYLVLMVVAGAGIAAQVAFNAQLGVVTASGLWAANICFLVSAVAGLAIVAGAAAFGRVTPPDPALWSAPWWVWAGGLCGAFYVLLAILLARRLGTAALSAAGILGQLGTALVIDHYGWFGMPVSRVSLTRVVGVVLLAMGVVLMRIGK